MIGFLQKNIFSRFVTPRAITSDRSCHIFNHWFKKFPIKYGVKQMDEMPYHPQSREKFEVRSLINNSSLF